MKRALLGADSHETSIYLRLAKLHNDLEEFKEAAAYHQRVVDICKSNRKPVPEYARSAIYVARYLLQFNSTASAVSGRLMPALGDLVDAKDLVDVVASSQAEEVGQVGELTKRIRARMADMEALIAANSKAKAEARAQAMEVDAGNVGLGGDAGGAGQA